MATGTFFLPYFSNASDINKPVSGISECSFYDIVWKWNFVEGASGYCWNTSNNYFTSINLGNVTSHTETNLLEDSNYTRYVWAYGNNVCQHSSATILTGTTLVFVLTGFTVNHTTINGVSPVDKTVYYDMVWLEDTPDIVWLNKNLGADVIPTGVTDPNENSAGWYWQFNKKQGYKFDSERIPDTDWITSISESSNWNSDQDPATIEFGFGWRVPTSSEWSTLDDNWTNWNGPWNDLKLHAAGRINYLTGNLEQRNFKGYYWSSEQYPIISSAQNLEFSGSQSRITTYEKSFGFPIRPVFDLNIQSPISGDSISYSTGITWKWQSVPKAIGYKWNSVDDYSTSVDVGDNLIKEETGLTPNTEYIRYVWAYKNIGHSYSSLIIKSTEA